MSLLTDRIEQRVREDPAFAAALVTMYEQYGGHRTAEMIYARLPVQPDLQPVGLPDDVRLCTDRQLRCFHKECRAYTETVYASDQHQI